LSQDVDERGLEYYLEPERYEAAFEGRSADVEFFVREALAQGGEVLEFGAGSGRVTLPLLRAGVRVTAVDLSQAMLARLEEKLCAEPEEVRERVRIVRGDMRSLRLGERFGLVLGTFNVVAHLHTRQELLAFLETAEHHLAPGGTILFDSMVPSSDELDADPEELFPCDPFVDSRTGEIVLTFEGFAYDPARRLLTIRTVYETRGVRQEGAPLVLRQWFPRELEGLLRERAPGRFQMTADYGEETDLTGADMLVVRMGARPLRPNSTAVSS
jgi:SAM-dependent methyltransferase